MKSAWGCALQNAEGQLSRQNYVWRSSSLSQALETSLSVVKTLSPSTVEIYGREQSSQALADLIRQALPDTEVILGTQAVPLLETSEGHMTLRGKAANLANKAWSSAVVPEADVVCVL